MTGWKHAFYCQFLKNLFTFGGLENMHFTINFSKNSPAAGQNYVFFLSFIKLFTCSGIKACILLLISQKFSSGRPRYMILIIVVECSCMIHWHFQKLKRRIAFAASFSKFIKFWNFGRTPPLLKNCQIWWEPLPI